ncbi:zinc finger and SCAN domain-containing protein 20 [Ixodes scapularis]|uniref:zinc finger and SCAN domain-containing protein 20 n=1 Tax=Ixodes scapularis TaxID=6945 RepID=UPI001A9F666F|nr:zinc finger and SCAN domain-containing protein 20 [Ixodes scapularis]
MSTTNLLEQGTSYLIVDCQGVIGDARATHVSSCPKPTAVQESAAGVASTSSWTEAVSTYKFSQESTRRFIIKRHELQHLFTGKRNTGKYGYQRIITELGLYGATVEQCRKKWLNLLKKYKELKTPPNGTNPENEELTWPYYSLLDAIMSGRAVNSPPCLVASASAGTGEQILEGDDGATSSPSCSRILTIDGSNCVASTSSSTESGSTFKFTEDVTRKFILKRHELQHLFTGKRNTGKYGYQRIIRELGLHGATIEQCRKKWLNLLKKYKELRTTNTEDEVLTWPYYSLLDSVLSGTAINLPYLVAVATGGAEECSERLNEDVTLQEDQLQEEEEEPVRPPPKRRRSDDLTERLLHNMERQTELMEQIFQFFKARASQS